MKKFRVMVIKYGWSVVEAETESEALELINDMQDKDFDWSDFDDGQVVEEVDYEQENTLYDKRKSIEDGRT